MFRKKISNLVDCLSWEESSNFISIILYPPFMWIKMAIVVWSPGNIFPGKREDPVVSRPHKMPDYFLWKQDHVQGNWNIQNNSASCCLNHSFSNIRSWCFVLASYGQVENRNCWKTRWINSTDYSGDHTKTKPEVYQEDTEHNNRTAVYSLYDYLFLYNLSLTTTTTFWQIVTKQHGVLFFSEIISFLILKLWWTRSGIHKLKPESM